MILVSPAKILFYLIELIHCYGAVYYSNFVFFYLRHNFGFSDAANLLTAALGGFVYIIMSWQSGKLAHRYGCIRMLYLGTVWIILSLTAGWIFSCAAAHVIIFCFWTAGVCFIWPALEALISAKSGDDLPKMIGIYNVIWAAGAAVGYFTAGLLIEHLGMKSLFWLPLVLMGSALFIISAADKLLKRESQKQVSDEVIGLADENPETKNYLKMAWLANPFAYVAINTVIPLIPSVAEKFDLSTGMAGVVCSLWLFARLFSFVVLWLWKGWHYHFGWLAGSFLLMIGCFFGILMSDTVMLLLAAQMGFGLSIGLIYYSSLYYSMKAEESQAANAGIHEAMIGAGLFAGPALGAATIIFTPAASIGSVSVGGLLGAGFITLLYLKFIKSK